ncbi:unnamed protein product [Mycena citricolor]|uniref:Uncharacterized protein n=1 Tax=Mycena citricolor TaxID=2018698 RepID=A0AAD2HZR3_9AGAR|nr:unnamed protein product [Mycena citricolor]
MGVNATTEEYPSLLWIAIPSVLLLSGFLARKWYLQRRLRVHGIGKGAPGFQTNVRRVRVTPEIMARIQRGEDVSPEEIAAASARMDAEERGETVAPLPAKSETSRPSKTKSSTAAIAKDSETDSANEWLPESITAPKKRTKGKRK